MNLNIKNEETCRLASELAQLTGETVTGAITVAPRERFGAGAGHSGTPQERACHFRTLR